MKHLYQLAADLDADVLEVRIEPGAFETKVTATHFLPIDKIEQIIIIREDDDSVSAFKKALEPFKKAVKGYYKRKEVKNED
jgi:hypothetical protein